MKALITATIKTPVIEGVTTGGTKFKKFGIAITAGGVNVQGKTSVFGVKVFGKQAELGLRTGDKVMVDGKLTVEDFQVSADKAALPTALVTAGFIEIADPSARMYAKAYNVLGNLTKNAELKTFGNEGKQLASTDMAINSKAGNQDLTSFVNIALFGKQATALSKYLVKGKKVLVDGSLSAYYFEKRTGGKGLAVSISVDDFQFAGGSSNNSDNNAPAQQYDAQAPEVDEEGEEIPF